MGKFFSSIEEAMMKRRYGYEKKRYKLSIMKHLRISVDMQKKQALSILL